MSIRLLFLSALLAAILGAQTPAPVRSWTEAEKLEADLEKQPDDVNTRVQLLRFYLSQSTMAERAETLRRKQILWMIEHHPENTVLASYAGVIDPEQKPFPDPEGYAACKAAWEKVLSSPKPLFDAFANATYFFTSPDPAQARRVAEQGLKLYPGNARISMRLGTVLAFLATGVKTTLPYTFGDTATETTRREREGLEKVESPDILMSAANTLSTLVPIMQSAKLHDRVTDTQDLAIRLYKRAGELDPNGSWRTRSIDAYMRFASSSPMPVERIALLGKALAMVEGSSQRAMVLTSLAQTFFDAGNKESAAETANAVLALENDNYRLSGQFALTTHTILARTALERGDPREAARQVQAVSKAPQDFQFGGSGPSDWSLAEELLDAGERASVLAYIEALRPFWKNDGGKLNRWASDIRTGATPDFTPPGQFPKTRYIGRPAPEVRLKDLNGAEVALADFKGKVVLLDFWATWCGPCRDEMPELQKIHAEGKDVVVLTVDVDEEAEKPAAYLEKEKFTFPVLLAKGTDLVRRYSVPGYPTTFGIDRNGLIADVIVGGGTNNGGRLAALVEKAGAGAIARPTVTVKPAGTDTTLPPTAAMTPEDYFRDATQQRTKRDYAGAVQSLDRALEMRPDWVEALLSRADDQMSLRRYDDAIAGFNHAIELDPKRATAYQGRAHAFAGAGRREEALADYARAIELNPATVVYIQRGALYLQIGRFDEALADMNHAIAMNPASAPPLLSRAQILEGRHEYAKAIADYDAVLRLQPLEAVQTLASQMRAADQRRLQAGHDSTPASPGATRSVRSHGQQEMRQSFALDLDDGASADKSADDLWFDALDARTRFLVPQNGAWAAVMGDQPAGFAGCSAAKLSANYMDVGALKKGTVICVVTSEGRIAEVTIDDISSKTPGRPDVLTLSVTYTTWER